VLRQGAGGGLARPLHIPELRASASLVERLPPWQEGEDAGRKGFGGATCQGVADHVVRPLEVVTVAENGMRHRREPPHPRDRRGCPGRLLQARGDVREYFLRVVGVCG